MLCSRYNRRPRNEWCSCRSETGALSGVLHRCIRRTAGHRLLASVPPQGWLYRQNMQHDECEDYTCTSMDHCCGHSGGNPTAKFLGRLIMKALTAIPAIMLLLCVAACNRLGTERPYAVLGDTSAVVRAAFNAD